MTDRVLFGMSSVVFDVIFLISKNSFVKEGLMKQIC